ncbi:MAG: UDP-N-acetylmuramoyl-tripeptide--D-alanyl-D-alanine ligase [Clostridiales Family XIII bacterium]|nr:UDP-N-acetylmuramoyl-tripeptide--D-alanyl-D-alanine ligase [Clostridiales Family XIII bacterium]
MDFFSLFGSSPLVCTISVTSCLIAGLCASALALLRHMHMFQLNSYDGGVHRRWMKANRKRMRSHVLALVVALFLIGMHVFVLGVLKIDSFDSGLLEKLVYYILILFPVWRGTALPLGMMFFFSDLCFRNRPVKGAKKPLALTDRVKRMLGAAAVMAAAVLAAAAAAGYFLLGKELDAVDMVIVFGELRGVPRVAEGFLLWPAALGLIYAAVPFMPIWANAMNRPIEAEGRRRYTEDAKRLLASCPNLLVIGITGSYGKTSMKYYLSHLLRAKYDVLMTPESYNTPMGVVKTIREQLRATHQVFVCEMGAKYEGEIKELCDIVGPTHGILTSIGPQHLETFKSMEVIAKTKFELADAVAGKGAMLVNGDDGIIAASLRGLRGNGGFLTYGCGRDNGYFAYDVSVSDEGTVFSMGYGAERIEGLRTRLIGEHNVTNLVGAIGMSLFLGVSPEDVRARLPKITPPPHRLALSRSGGVTIIDDSYNSNPHGSAAALRTLALFEGCRVLVTPGMVELGERQWELNREFGAHAARVCDYVMLVGEAQTRPIREGLAAAGFDAARLRVAATVQEALAMAYGAPSDKPKVILIENDLPDNY